jgi:hypothetical protein
LYLNEVQAYRLIPGEDDHELYEMLSPALQRDPDLIIAAYKSKILKVSNPPPPLWNDRDLWMRLMEKEPRLWLFLPTEFENDPAFARSIQNVRSEKEPVPAIFQRFPVLMADRAFWVSLITTMHKKARNWGALRKLIQRHAPGHLKRDRALMVLACRHDASVFETLSILLQQDRECEGYTAAVP